MVVLAGTALAAGLLTPPAQADTGPVPVTLTVTGTYTGVFVNGLQIVASCVAVAGGAVSATVIDRCYLTVNHIDHPSTAPGNATASAFVEEVTDLEFELCYHAYAIPMDDPLNPVFASGCTDEVLPLGLAGLGTTTTTQ